MEEFRSGGRRSCPVRGERANGVREAVGNVGSALARSGSRCSVEQEAERRGGVVGVVEDVAAEFEVTPPGTSLEPIIKPEPNEKDALTALA